MEKMLLFFKHTVLCDLCENPEFQYRLTRSLRHEGLVQQQSLLYHVRRAAAKRLKYRFINGKKVQNLQFSVVTSPIISSHCRFLVCMHLHLSFSCNKGNCGYHVWVTLCNWRVCLPVVRNLQQTETKQWTVKRQTWRSNQCSDWSVARSSQHTK